MWVYWRVFIFSPKVYLIADMKHEAWQLVITQTSWSRLKGFPQIPQAFGSSPTTPPIQSEHVQGKLSVGRVMSWTKKPTPWFLFWLLKNKDDPTFFRFGEPLIFQKCPLLVGEHPKFWEVCWEKVSNTWIPIWSRSRQFMRKKKNDDPLPRCPSFWALLGWHFDVSSQKQLHMFCWLSGRPVWLSLFTKPFTLK